jgi:hypothetical protein
MFEIPHNFKAFQFQTGVDRISQAYNASAAAMEKAKMEAEDIIAKYEASGEDDSEYDDDGILIHSTRHSLNYAEMNANLAITVVREAFITSAFHYWEISARGWTGLHDKNHKFRALIEASSLMYAICPKLEKLNSLNNSLKHHSHHHSVTHEDVEEAFEIVRASGPIYQS